MQHFQSQTQPGPWTTSPFSSWSNFGSSWITGMVAFMFDVDISSMGLNFEASTTRQSKRWTFLSFRRSSICWAKSDRYHPADWWKFSLLMLGNSNLCGFLLNCLYRALSSLVGSLRNSVTSYHIFLPYVVFALGSGSNWILPRSAIRSVTWTPLRWSKMRVGAMSLGSHASLSRRLMYKSSFLSWLHSRRAAMSWCIASRCFSHDFSSVLAMALSPSHVAYLWLSGGSDLRYL